MEIVLLSMKKHLDEMESFKNGLKQVLSLLPQNVADPCIYLLSEYLLVREQIHIKALNFFNNVCNLSEACYMPGVTRNKFRKPKFAIWKVSKKHF